MSALSSFSPHIPPLAPTLRQLCASSAVRDAAGGARRSLAALRRALADPSPQASAIVVFVEARASCAIEDLVSAQEALAPLSEPSSSTSIVPILACQEAITCGWRAELPICRRLAEFLCATITRREVAIRRAPGTALRRGSDGQVVYTPPVGAGRIADLLSDWAAAMNDPGHDPLVQMAAGHAHFELIHPFLDGNGRTGRALNVLHLVARKVLPSPFLCMSDLLLRRRDTYYRLLLEVTEQAGWAAWTCFMLEVLEDAAMWTRHLLGREAGSGQTSPRQ